MKNTKYFLFLLAALFMVSWRAQRANSIVVTIENFRNAKGQVLISLFKDGEGYPDQPEKAIRKERANILAGNKASITLTELPPGSYAVVVLHDENSNLKMDKTWLGLPKEGYGFSNNVMGTFGPPSFSKASFRHAGQGDTPVVIKLRY